MYTKKKEWILTAVYLAFLAGAIIIYLNNDDNDFLGIIQTVIYCALIVVWIVMMRNRVMQRGVSRWLTIMCILLIVWIFLRGAKYYLVPINSYESRMLWYHYYIPMLFFPACAIISTIYIGKINEWRLYKQAYVLLVISALLMILVLTNDYHQLVFVFPDNGQIWSDAEYSYGYLFYLVYSWFIVCIIAILGMLIRKCRIPHKRKIIIWPIIPQVLLIIYNILYLTGNAEFYGDMIVTISFLTIFSYEIAIRVKLIQTNTDYIDIFQRSSAALKIIDNNLEVVYESKASDLEDKEILNNVIWNGLAEKGGTIFVSSPVDDGYIVWQEDINELIAVKEKLESANEYLEGEREALNENLSSTMERKRLEEQNRLYDLMQNDTSQTQEALILLLEKFKNSNAEEEKSYLCLIGAIIIYLKRRNNLVFLTEESNLIPSSELYNYIKELSSNLVTFGIECEFIVDMDSLLKFHEMVRLYDILEIMLERTLPEAGSYFITVSKKNDIYLLNVRVSGIEDADRLKDLNNSEDINIEQEDDNEFLLTYRLYEEIENER